MCSCCDRGQIYCARRLFVESPTQLPTEVHVGSCFANCAMSASPAVTEFPTGQRPRAAGQRLRRRPKEQVEFSTINEGE
jgi:hypothetical protein